MKKISSLLIALLFFMIASAQVKFDALSFNPVFPKTGDKLNFEYNASYSPLKNEKEITFIIYRFNGIDWDVVEPKMTKTGNLYKGTVMLDSNTTSLGFAINAGEAKDINGGKGYIIPVYNADKNISKGALITSGNLYAGMGENLFGMAKNAETALLQFESAKEKYPELAQDQSFLGNYWGRLSQTRKSEADEKILAELNKYALLNQNTELDYNFSSQWYSRLKQKTTADSLLALMKDKYPNGKWKRNEMIQSFYKEKDPLKKVVLYNAFVAAYPPEAKEENEINFYKSSIAESFVKTKDYTSYEKWNAMLSPFQQMSNNNNFSWAMAEEGEDLEGAKKMSYAATMYAKNEMLHPTAEKPKYISQADWKKQRERTYGMYADTYGYILYLLGDYKTAYPYAKEAAEINKFKDAEYNERYALIMAKTEPVSDAKPIIEDFVKNGVATAKTKDALKELYIAQNKSEIGYDAYLAKLEAAAREKMREEIAKTIMNIDAPNFSLKDFDGKTVSLADMKGKIIVVDFWATWCGPCIASMPGMKTSMEKYASNPNVKYLFVDTWETSDNKLKNAKDFMEQKKYPFYVLMDTQDKMVTDYGVAGIPTKFIIDKNGKIRFKAVGFQGTADALVDEMDIMIELAGK